MLTVVINLDAATERLLRIKTVLDSSGVKFQRIPALDGRDIRNADIISQYRADYGIRIPATDLACTISHRRAWELMLSTDHKFMAVLEDDCVFGRDFQALLSEDWIPTGADLIKLEANHPEARLGRKSIASMGGRHLYRLGGHHPGTAAYIISQKGAEMMLRLTERNYTFLDTLMFNYRHPPMLSLGVYQVVPAPCIQDTVLAILEGRHDEIPSCMVRPHWVFQCERMPSLFVRKLRKAWESVSLVYRRKHRRFERMGRPQRVPFE